MIRRTHTYIVIGVGILLIVAGFLRVPGGVPVGASLCFLGLALFGLSFVPRQAPRDDTPPPMSFFERLSGIFFEPSKVFRNLRSHPRWLVALILMSLLSFAYTTAFTFRLTPERIVTFTNEKLVEQGWVPAEQVAAMTNQQVRQAKQPTRIAGNAVTTFVGAFVIMCIIAGLYMLGVLLVGGRLGFWEALSVAVWAALPVTLISRLLSLVLLYLKEPEDIHPILGQSGLVTDNLGALVRPADGPVLFAVLSGFGVLAFYGLWLAATGLRNAGDRVKSGSAWAIAIAFWVIGLLISVASSALFGNFIS